MRVLAAAAVLAAVSVSGGFAASAAQALVVRSHGIEASLPPGWRLARQALAVCTSPAQLMAVTNARGLVPKQVRGGTALILLMEDRYGRPANYPPRKHFAVRAIRGSIGGCCDIPIGPGQELTFRDHGRNLYAFVYAGNKQLRAAAERVLNSLKVSPR
jgi:hypothetical protein